MSLKNPVTPPEIDPGTVRLVAQRLNHYTTPGPEMSILMDKDAQYVVMLGSGNAGPFNFDFIL
jgi:hypothetical protein